MTSNAILICTESGLFSEDIVKLMNNSKCLYLADLAVGFYFRQVLSSLLLLKILNSEL